MNARLNTAETLALAVLKGDQDAIGPLLDCLSEQYRDGNVYLRPLLAQGQVTDVGRLRAIFYVDADTDVELPNHPDLLHAYTRWLHEGRPLALVGVDRVEFYELPEPKVSPPLGLTTREQGVPEVDAETTSGRPATTMDVYHWPEFKAFAQRLGIRWEALTTYLRITMDVEDVVKVAHLYTGEKDQ